jgi:cytochrome c peroxidase
MRPRPAPSFLLFLGSALVGSTWSANDATRQGKEIPPSVVGAIVDSPFQLRLGDSVDVVTLSGNPNGLQALKGVITGTPKQPMVMQAVRQRPGLPTADTTWIVAFGGALDEPYLPSVPYRYRGASLDIPAHLSRIAFFGPRSSPEALALEANPTSDAGAALGRVLFYDRRLSANDGVSCASCHLQSAGFGDTARFSLGYRRQPTKRHSMALTNVRFSAGGGFFWDQRAKTLEQQVLMPIQDGIEMGMSLENLQRKLQVIPYYPALYDAAFGSPEITIERTARALAQFLRTMVSADSPFDRAFQTTSPGGVVGLTPQQTEGQALFRSSGCSLCHSQVTHAVVRAMNTGLDSTPADSGAGRGMFRAPSLRNVAIRAPYMHDGRFKSLDEVIDFYSSGVRENPDLDVRLRNRGTQGPRRFHLSDEQRAALLAFLHALTDSTFLTAPEFSDPFTRAKKGME